MPSSTQRTVSRVLFLIGFSLVTAASVGCGAKKSTVSGDVKYNGKPLPSGTITFLGQSGHKQVVSADVVDGHYTMQGVEPGPVQVTVVTVPPSKGGQPPHGKAIETPGTANAAKPYVAIPPRFAKPESSSLSYEVTSGTQTKDFDLPR